MKKLLLTSAALAALSFGGNAALAADMPVKAKPVVILCDWNGFYIGVSWGWACADVDRRFDLLGPGGVVSDFNTKGDNWIYDLHIGVQGQWGNFVGGIEANWSLTNKGLKGITNLPEPPFIADLAGVHRVSEIYQAGIRLGWAWDCWLFYVSGGWALAQIDHGYKEQSTGEFTFLNFSGVTHNEGWYVGIGGEYVLHRGTVVDVVSGFEYQHFEFDEERAFCVNSSAGCTPLNVNDYHVKADVDVFRARLSIKTKGWSIWNEPAVVAKN
jgi:opacity protein-like surface antigen